MAAIYSQMFHKKNIYVRRELYLYVDIYKNTDEERESKTGKKLHSENLGKVNTEILCSIFATFL